MPLLTSPIGGAPMRQIFRHGIEFDVCPTTGGVWLDKGELARRRSAQAKDLAAAELAWIAATEAVDAVKGVSA